MAAALALNQLVEPEPAAAAWHDAAAALGALLLSGAAVLPASVIIRSMISRSDAGRREVLIQRELAESEAQFRSLFEAATLSILIHDYETGEVIEANRRAVESYDLSSIEELRNRNIFDDPPYSQIEARNWVRLARDAGPQRFEWRSRRRDGTIFWEDVFLQTIPMRGVQRIVAISFDISDRKRIEEELRASGERMQHMAQHDTLTGLPNRALFADRLRQAISLAERNRTSLALLYVDMDHFKPINDNYGHAVGDEVLKEFAARMCGAIRASDTAGRIGGDEFNVLLASVEDSAAAAAVAGKIADELARPMEIEGHTLAISASIGIALYPDHGSDEQELVRNADRAMYRCKQAGGRTAFPT